MKNLNAPSSNLKNKYSYIERVYDKASLVAKFVVKVLKILCFILIELSYALIFINYYLTLDGSHFYFLNSINTYTKSIINNIKSKTNESVTMLQNYYCINSNECNYFYHDDSLSSNNNIPIETKSNYSLFTNYSLLFTDLKHVLLNANFLSYIFNIKCLILTAVVVRLYLLSLYINKLYKKYIDNFESSESTIKENRVSKLA
jgi:hypothetical protein